MWRYHSARPAVNSVFSSDKPVSSPWGSDGDETERGMGAASSSVPKRGVLAACAFSCVEELDVDVLDTEGMRTHSSSISVIM